MLRVASIAPGSLAAELHLEPGTELLAIDGKPLGDFLDYEFLSAEDAFLLHVRRPDGEEVEFDIERPEGMPMGLVLEPPRIRRCANRCDFCFVEGNPQGARAALFVRDDDYRLSFRHGNFATLTNLGPRDEARILEYRLSPLYVSVHATDPEVRRRLLRNPRAPAVLPQLERFASGGIRFHAQIVLVPGVNDGAVLDRSLSDLFALGGTVLSVGVVPVALTSHSRLDAVRGPDGAEARAALEAVRRWALRARGERGEGWVYGSDELYLIAGVPFPPAEAYDGFPQVENGVGAVRRFLGVVERERRRLAGVAGLRILVLTGTAMAALMPPILESLESASGATFDCLGVENGFFGPGVTTAGLLAGRDIARALCDSAGGFDLALLPAEAVNDDGVFVDDLPLAEVVAGAPMEVRASHTFADALATPEGGR